MPYTFHGEPCRNYCFFASEHIPCDPYDGREKYVLSTCVTGGNGRIYLIDPDAGTREEFEFPDTAAWAVKYLPDYEKLLIGTAMSHGYVMALDLKTRTWSEPLRCDGETYVWSFARDKNGLVYGSDYPLCRMFIYDPAAHTLTLSDRVSANEKNLYCRHVFTHPDGNIVCSVGFDCCESYYYDVDKKTFTRFGIDGDWVDTPIQNNIIRSANKNGTYRFYDPDTLELVDKPVSIANPSLEGLTDPRVIANIKDVIDPPYGHLIPGRCGRHMRTLNDGSVFGIKGQTSFRIKDDAISFAPVPGTPPSTDIFGIAADENGRIWFATGLGQTMGWYEPSTGDYWNSDAMTPIGGEAYGIVPVGGKVYFSTYSGGDHVVYDPNAEWSQYDNQNPKTLESCGKNMIRPIGRSILGPDGHVWIGWSGLYGVYGGGLTRIHTDTHEVDIRHGIIPLQAHGCLTASDTYVYSTTNGTTSGLNARADEFYLLRHDMNMDVVWSEKFALGQFPQHVTVADGRLFLVLADENTRRDTLRIYDETTMELLDEQCICTFADWRDRGANGITYMTRYDDKTFLLFVGTEVRRICAATMEIIETQPLPRQVRLCTVAPDGSVWFGCGTKLYRLTFEK